MSHRNCVLLLLNVDCATADSQLDINAIEFTIGDVLISPILKFMQFVATHFIMFCELYQPSDYDECM